MRFYKGNPAGEVLKEFKFGVETWTLALKSSMGGFMNFKLYSSGTRAVPYKGNYWISAKHIPFRMVQSKTLSILLLNRTDLYKQVEAWLRSYYG